ncbi:MAG: flagellar brake protein [Gallionella sp.]
MNLQPIPIEHILPGKPLPWQIYDRNGYIVFSQGEIITSLKQLEEREDAGLYEDIDAPSQANETSDWSDFAFNKISPSDIFPPHGIKPQIGEFVQLVLPNRNPQNFYSARLIGCVKNLSILVTRPVDAPFIPAEGETVEVRMVTGSNIYTFQTTIQRLCISPSQYLHLDYPPVVNAQKLRKSPWARVNLNVITTDADGNREFARLINLSSDGGQLRAPAKLGKTGDTLQLSLHAVMENLNCTLNISASIMHVRTSHTIDADMQEFGVSFNHVAPTDSLWLKALVYRHIAEGEMA